MRVSSMADPDAKPGDQAVATEVGASSPPLRDLVCRAQAKGREITLDRIGYGRIHWGDFKQVKSEPSPYYYFLAGFVRVLGLTRICEIGTHSGGASRAMRRGIGDTDGARIVTVDVTRESDRYLKDETNIQKVVGDANDQDVAARIANMFGDTHTVDLLYIDAAHTYVSTALNYGIYTTLLSPRFVILDDININSEMRSTWSKICASLDPGQTLDVSTVLPEIRSPNVGFGLVSLNRHGDVPHLDHSITMAHPLKRRLRQAIRYLGSARLGRI